MIEVATCEPDIGTELTTQENQSEGLFVLPGGILDNEGACYKQVYLRELTGADEEILGDRRYQNSARQVTDLLAKVIEKIDGYDGAFDPAQMLVGDRDYLLLRLRQMNIGDYVHQVMRCPERSCGKKADVEFSVSELAVRSVDKVKPSYGLTLSRPALPDVPHSDQVRLRFPNGEDQEYVLSISDLNTGTANTKLFSRILLKVGQLTDIDEDITRALSLKARVEITDFLRNQVPGPDLNIDIQCPYCGTDMSYPFDLHSFFFEELSLNTEQLFREVHHLAYHYHWSERDILELSRGKRQRYIGLLAEQLAASKGELE